MSLKEKSVILKKRKENFRIKSIGVHVCLHIYNIYANSGINLIGVSVYLFIPTDLIVFVRKCICVHCVY